MEEEFYKYVSPAEITKDLNLPKELATKIHKYWALKRKVLYIPFNRKQLPNQMLLSWCVTSFAIYTQSVQLQWLEFFKQIKFLLWWLLGLHCFAMKHQFLLRLFFCFFCSKLVIFSSMSVTLMFSPWKFNLCRWLQWECFPLWQLFASTCWAGRGMEFLLWYWLFNCDKQVNHPHFSSSIWFFLISYSGCI